MKYLKHKLTAYHFRRNRGDRSTVLAICDCGWKCRPFRKKLGDLTRQMKCIRGHDWDNWDPIETGEIYEENGEYKSTIDDGEGYVLGSMRQCERCYKCETKK